MDVAKVQADMRAELRRLASDGISEADISGSEWMPVVQQLRDVCESALLGLRLTDLAETGAKVDPDVLKVAGLCAMSGLHAVTAVLAGLKSQSDLQAG